MTRLSQYIPPLLFSHSISLLVLWRSIDRQITVDACVMIEMPGRLVMKSLVCGSLDAKSERDWAYLIEEFFVW